MLWIFYRRYSSKIDAVRNTYETKVAICNFQKSSGVAIAKRGVEVAEERIANRGKSSECPALVFRELILQILYWIYEIGIHSCSRMCEFLGAPQW
jgi:hypothetical protein